MSWFNFFKKTPEPLITVQLIQKLINKTENNLITWKEVSAYNKKLTCVLTGFKFDRIVIETYYQANVDLYWIMIQLRHNRTVVEELSVHSGEPNYQIWYNLIKALAVVISKKSDRV